MQNKGLRERVILIDMQIKNLACLTQVIGLLSFIMCFLLIESPCFASPTLPDPDPTTVPRVQMIPADQQCGKDRQCRLARLKKLNQARRLSKLKGIDFKALKYMKSTDAYQQSTIIRQQRIWGLDLSSFYFGAGVTGRYAFSPRWQLSLSYLYTSFASEEAKLSKRIITVQSIDNIPFVDASLLYLSSLKALSPYFGLSLRYGKGDLIVEDTNASAPTSGGIIGQVIGSIAGGGGGFAQERGEGEFHLVGLTAGLDYQSQMGLHCRLGASYHFPLFVGHRDSESGQNFQLTKESLSTWTSTLLSLNYEVSLGWTF